MAVLAGSMLSAINDEQRTLGLGLGVALLPLACGLALFWARPRLAEQPRATAPLLVGALAQVSTLGMVWLARAAEFEGLSAVIGVVALLGVASLALIASANGASAKA